MRAFLTSALLLLTACAGGAPSDADTGDSEVADTEPVDRATAILAMSADAVAGADVYTSRCSLCHRADGTGSGSAGDLNDEVPALSQAEILEVLLEGPGPMPAFESLDDQDLADVLAYLDATFR